jgi:hypothetical protein
LNLGEAIENGRPRPRRAIIGMIMTQHPVERFLNTPL